MKHLTLALAFVFACDDATMLVVDDAYTDGAKVDGVWWSETLVPDVAAGTESAAYRANATTDYAYALLDRGGSLTVLRSKTPLAVSRGDTLDIVVGPDTFDGDCASPASTPLPQAIADLVTQSIFPAPFVGAIYDAATCKTARPEMPDAGDQ